LEPRYWSKPDGACLLMKEVVKIMLKHGGGGSIVNVASKAGLSGAVAGVAYTASKHGLVGATKNVAWRYRGDDIRCNAICPGGVATNITSSIDTNNMDMEAYAILKPIHDVHSFNPKTSVEQISNLLLFLSSDASKTISGAIIPIDYAWSTI